VLFSSGELILCDCFAATSDKRTADLLRKATR
jgi:hypothetical protein